MKRDSRIGLFAIVLLFVWDSVCLAEPPSHSHPHPGPVASELQGLTIPQEFWDRLEMNFLMELEGFAAKVGGESESDITVATLELTLDAEVSDGISGHVGLLWEEDDAEENNLDEAYLTFGSSASIPFYLSVGKMYLPFGDFESAFISDPLTLELAEIRESAALAGYANNWIDVNMGAFNGDREKDADGNSLEEGVASITFQPSDEWTFGAYWLSDLLEADGFEDVVGDGHKARSGAGAFVSAQVGPVSVSAEYVTALETIEFAGVNGRPSTYNLEASAPLHEKWTAGIKFEGSDEFYSDAGRWAEWQTGLVCSYVLNQKAIISGEYLHGDGWNDDESSDQATVQIALTL
jgi:hypothetical protein